MKRMKGGTNARWMLFVCILIGLTLLGGMACASSGGGEEHGAVQDSGGKLKDLGYRILNFALLVIILFVVIRKTAVKNFFSNRREEIRQKFDDLKAERDEAQKRSQALEQKLKAFETEQQKILEQFKAEGIAEKEKIIAQAQERAGHILVQADLTIQREVQAAKDRLKQEVVDLAAQRALDIVTQEIKQKDQDQLVDEFIERVGKVH